MVKIRRMLYSWDRAEHMRQLHAQGRYKGTSKIGLWNISEEKRKRMEIIRMKNALDKTSTGYGSERYLRTINYELLKSKFHDGGTQPGFLYFLEFPKSIKVGYSKDWKRRTSREILGGKVICIVSGETLKLGQLEYDVFIEFINYTLLNEEGTRYTEFIDKKVKRKVWDFIKTRVDSDPELKFEIIGNTY